MLDDDRKRKSATYLEGALKDTSATAAVANDATRVDGQVVDLQYARNVRTFGSVDADDAGRRRRTSLGDLSRLHWPNDDAETFRQVLLLLEPAK